MLHLFSNCLVDAHRLYESSISHLPLACFLSYSCAAQKKDAIPMVVAIPVLTKIHV